MRCQLPHFQSPPNSHTTTCMYKWRVSCDRPGWARLWKMQPSRRSISGSILGSVISDAGVSVTWIADNVDGQYERTSGAAALHIGRWSMMPWSNVLSAGLAVAFNIGQKSVCREKCWRLLHLSRLSEGPSETQRSIVKHLSTTQCCYTGESSVSVSTALNTIMQQT